MRWFKHFSDSLDDPFIQELIDHFGPAGYLAYFGLIEIMARENGHKLTGRLSASPSYLSRKLRLSVAKLQRVFNHCATAAKLSFKSDSEKWIFDFPKMLDLKDNYTKDLQAADKKLSNHKEVEVEVEKEEEEEKKKELKTTPELKDAKTKYGEFRNVQLTEVEHRKLKAKLGGKETQDYIEAVSRYKKSKGKAYKDDYAAILAWYKRDGKEPQRVCSEYNLMPPITDGVWSHPEAVRHGEEIRCPHCGWTQKKVKAKMDDGWTDEERRKADEARRRVKGDIDKILKRPAL